MTDNQLTLFPPRTVEEFVEDLERLTLEIQELYCLDEIPWCVGLSGGKDSSATLQLVWNAVAKLPIEKRQKTIHVITTDTLVENPVVATWVRTSLERMKQEAQEQRMPVEPHLLQPTISSTYWVNLLGKGYPVPRHSFRWCTPRLKVEPSNQFIRDVVRANGETIVVLGIRKTESSNRASIMEKREANRVRNRLSPHPSLPNSLLYSPIEDWRTDEVWMYLMQWDNPWGISNKDLFAMYRGATADNECPLVVDTSTPSCGSSRFGCWVCTLVDQDKSMEAMVQNDEEKEWLQPLLDIRSELEIKDERDKRDFRRIYGKVELFERNLDGETSIEPIPGPYRKEWREYLLRRLLEAQEQIRRTAPPEMQDITLISIEELSEIRRIWLEEKHEFDDSLPKIYEEVIGQPFEDPRPSNERNLLGSDEWAVLEDVCQQDAMHLELMSRLLNTERQVHTKSRRGIYEKLEKCFDISSRSQQEAIDNAHYQRHVKTTLQALKEDTAEPHEIKEILDKTTPDPTKQLTWGSLKFSIPPATENDDEEDDS